jgi:hypothetical protein
MAVGGWLAGAGNKEKEEEAVAMAAAVAVAEAEAEAAMKTELEHGVKRTGREGQDQKFVKKGEKRCNCCKFVCNALLIKEKEKGKVLLPLSQKIRRMGDSHPRPVSERWAILKRSPPDRRRLNFWQCP